MQHDNRRRHKRRSLLDLTSDMDLLYEENPSLEMLENLHSDSNARSLLADEIDDSLVSDENASILYSLAGNPNTSIYLLKKICLANHEGKHYWVFYRHVASNPSAPADLLKRIANFPDVTTRCSIAKHNNTPE